MTYIQLAATLRRNDSSRIQSMASNALRSTWSRRGPRSDCGLRLPLRAPSAQRDSIGSPLLRAPLAAICFISSTAVFHIGAKARGSGGRSQKTQLCLIALPCPCPVSHRAARLPPARYVLLGPRRSPSSRSCLFFTATRTTEWIPRRV